MSEKNKWFDPKPEPQLIVLPGMRSTSPVTREQFERLFEQLVDNKKVATRTYVLATALGELSAVHRLSRNLKVVVGILGDSNVGHAVRDLITHDEYRALVNISLVGVSKESQEVMYRLLNIGERFQLQTTLKTVFAAARKSDSTR